MNKIVLLSLTLLLSLSALAQETDISYTEPQEYEIAGNYRFGHQRAQ